MKPLFKWRHQYDTDADTKEGDIAALECLDESLTQQHFTKDADINEIARRFGLTQIPLGQLDPSLFRDTTNDPDLATVLQHQNDARNEFAKLPAALQRRFRYNPAELWNFINDPDNHEEVIRLGLLRTPEGSASPATTGSSTEDAPPWTRPEPPKSAPENPPKGPQTTSQKETSKGNT